MKTFIDKNKWWFYFVLTYLISWPVWTLGRIILPESMRMITLIIGGFGPFIAAIAIVRKTRGNQGLKEWLKATFNFRIKITWYLLGAIVFPFMIAGVHHLVYIFLGGKPGVQPGPEWLIYFVYLLSTALLSGGNEEPGWRAYITPVLADRFHPALACTFTGIGWAVWHLPLYFIQGWGGNDQPFVWLLAYCIPLSMILTWLYNVSRKSIIPVMLLHAGTNVVFRYFPMETRIFDNVADEFTLIKTVVYLLFAIVLLVITRGSLGLRKYSPHGNKFTG